jgi:trans-2,3-dihydro-3-hydroxyanthranilate isomerase
MRQLAVVTVDVFTSRPLQGNQLAVFTDARGLGDAEMQSLAKEMNLSETTFIFPRDSKQEREQGVQVRIFTPAEELPFAGHPTLGTAWVLQRMNGTKQIDLELKVGKIPVTFTQKSEGLFGEMTQRPPEFGQIHKKEEVARAFGFAAEDFDFDLPIQTVSTGVPFVIAPLRSLQELGKLSFEWKRAEAYLDKTDAKLIYFVCRKTEDANVRLRARMIFYNGEDPATGSAAGCAAAWMVQNGVAQPDEQVLIHQGVEMGRPSRIFVRAEKRGEAVENVRVGGYCAEVMRGEVALQ